MIIMFSMQNADRHFERRDINHIFCKFITLTTGRITIMLLQLEFCSSAQNKLDSLAFLRLGKECCQSKITYPALVPPTILSIWPSEVTLLIPVCVDISIAFGVLLSVIRSKMYSEPALISPVLFIKTSLLQITV